MTPDKPTQTLIADPPWQFGDKLPGPGRGAARHYATLSVAAICAFPLPPLAPNCRLFLWRVAAMQAEALAVMDAWGFTLKAEIVWLKQTRHGKPWFGMGRTVRNSHEVCLIGHRGRPLTLSHSVRSVFTAPVPERGHSAKPEQFRDIVEALSPGPYTELFARTRRAGWVCQGLEVESA